MVVANLGLTPEKVILHLNEARWGGVRNLTDTLTGSPVECHEGQVALEIGGKDFRLLQWQRSPDSTALSCLTTSGPQSIRRRRSARRQGGEGLACQPTSFAEQAAIYRDRSGCGNEVRSSSYCHPAPGKIGSAVEFAPGNGGYLLVPSSDSLSVRDGLTIQSPGAN
jgi:hypothetical protein